MLMCGVVADQIGAEQLSVQNDEAKTRGAGRGGRNQSLAVFFPGQIKSFLFILDFEKIM